LGHQRIFGVVVWNVEFLLQITATLASWINGRLEDNLDAINDKKIAFIAA